MIDPQELAEAVAHWLRFEHLCRRDVLFTERHMTHAIGQYLIAVCGELVEPEAPHPELPDRLIDFAVRTEDRQHFQDVIETKLVTGKRDFRKEIVRDVLRLELASLHLHEGGAWLLIAGLGAHMKMWMFGDDDEPEQAERIQPGYQDVNGDGSVLILEPIRAVQPPKHHPAPLEGILAPAKSHDPVEVNILASEGLHPTYWQESFAKCDNKGPTALVTHLQGRWIMDDAIGDDMWMCMVWRVSSSNPRVVLNGAQLGSVKNDGDDNAPD